MENKNYHKAEPVLLACLASRPYVADTRFHLITLYHLTGQPEKVADQLSELARWSWRFAQSRRPDHPWPDLTVMQEAGRHGIKLHYPDGNVRKLQEAQLFELFLAGDPSDPSEVWYALQSGLDTYFRICLGQDVPRGLLNMRLTEEPL
jgi:hypothetical protein